VRLGAAATTDPVVELGNAAQAIELATRQAARTVGSFALWLASLHRSARRIGVAPAALIGPALDDETRAWLAAALHWGKAVRALDNGTAELQPYQRPGEPVRFAVRRVGGAMDSLGWWAAAVKVLQVAGGAALTGAGYMLGDAWLDTKKLEAAADQTRANVLAQLTAKAGSDPRAAAEIAKAVGQADRDSADPSSWFDKLTGSAGAGLGGAAVALGVIWFMGRRKR
jgi:hypothetical protein